MIHTLILTYYNGKHNYNKTAKADMIKWDIKTRHAINLNGMIISYEPMGRYPHLMTKYWAV